MQITSKWQTHLPYLRLETLREHNSLSDNYKMSINLQRTRTRAPSWVTEPVMHMR